MMGEYKLSIGDSEATLELAVNSLMRSGWEPLGGASVSFMPTKYGNGVGFFRYVQAMTKESGK